MPDEPESECDMSVSLTLLSSFSLDWGKRADKSFGVSDCYHLDNLLLALVTQFSFQVFQAKGHQVIYISMTRSLNSSLNNFLTYRDD